MTLVSAEGEKFVVPKRVAQLSELVKTMTDEGSGEEVPLMDVKVCDRGSCGASRRCCDHSRSFLSPLTL